MLGIAFPLVPHVRLCVFYGGEGLGVVWRHENNRNSIRFHRIFHLPPTNERDVKVQCMQLMFAKPEKDDFPGPLCFWAWEHVHEQWKVTADTEHLRLF